jgi:hypothetical protein
VVNRRLRLHLTALALVGAAGLSGCTGSSAPAPSPTVTSPTPSPSPSLTAAEQLQQLAGLGTKAVFRATYVVRQRRPATRAQWRVWRTRGSLRVDVVTKHSTATLISTRHATYSCSRARHHRACFRVATAGRPVPHAVRLLAVRLFSADLILLSAHPERYGIAAATAGSVTVPTHGGTCFHLTVPKQTSTSTIETGSYCFDSNGIPTAVEYPNGNVVRATHLVAEAPKRSVFVPYSSPTPLPS